MRRGTNRSRTSVANGERIAEVDESFHHSVHVLRHPSVLRRNPKCEPTKTMRLHRQDRATGRAALRESREGTKIDLGRTKVRYPFSVISHWFS
jgi:hypothetical protein